MGDEYTYKTIKARSEGLFKDRGSRFISVAFPVSTETEVKEIISSLRKEYYDARHHCYAFRIGVKGETYRFSDDGEPSGTAGRPILGQLLSNDLTNIFVAVIRYFGGTKLGVSGLINAYRSACADAVKNSEIIEETLKTALKIQFPFSAMNAVMKILKEFECFHQEHEYSGEECIIKFSVSMSDKNKICGMLEKLSSLNVIYIS